MRRHNEFSVWQCWILVICGPVGLAGCGGSQTADGTNASSGAEAEAAVAKEFDRTEEGRPTSKGAYLLDGNTLKIVSGFPGTPRVVDLASKDEMAMTMSMTRASGEGKSIVGKWKVNSAVFGGKEIKPLIDSEVEFTADKMISMGPRGKPIEESYRLGGVAAAPAKPSTAKAE